MCKYPPIHVPPWNPRPLFDRPYSLTDTIYDKVLTAWATLGHLRLDVERRRVSNQIDYYLVSISPSNTVTSMASTTIRRLGSLSRALPSQTAGFANSNKPLLFLAAGTANGRKVSVLLEELKAAYGLDYEYVYHAFRHSAPHDR